MSNSSILVVVDTAGITSSYPKQSNPNVDSPVGISHNFAWMICSPQSNVISGQGTADLNFKAQPGDNVSFRGTSVTQNSTDAVIVYQIKYWNGTNVFNTFVTDQVTLTGAAQPNPANLNGLPAVSVTQNFQSLDSRISKQGTENFYVMIAVYTLDAATGEKQQLYGYFYWDPTVTVS